MKPTATIEWQSEYVGNDVSGWCVLASPGSASVEPRSVATVGRDFRSAEVELDEGTWYIRVVPVFKDGSIGDWTTVTPSETNATVREEAPPTPTDAAVAFVDSAATARVADEPPTQADSKPYYQEVIVGPDADRGQLVAEATIEPAGPLMPDGQRVASASFPVEAHGAGETLDVLVRNVGMGGRAGTAVAKTVAVPPTLDSDHHAIPIVVVSGATHTNLRNPTTTDGWEFDATDGLRLLAFPAASGMTADWTTILNANEYLSDYVDNAFIESDEIDLGAVLRFRLSSSQTVQRKTATGSIATRSAAMYMDPVDPLSNPLAKDGVLSPLWYGRELGADGKARRPIRPQDVQVKVIVSSSSGFAHASSDYKSTIDGGWLRGRYVRVAMFLREPYANFQLICPRWTVSAHVFRTTTVGTGTPESSVSAPPGSRFTRTDGPPYEYVKATGVGNTGWLGSAADSALAAEIAARIAADALLLVKSANLSDVASAGTSRTNLGVGTGDSPQFAGVNVGHASDTTLTRASAGDVAVEGKTLYRVDGTDVSVADGGTGASDAANARTNLGLGSVATLTADPDTTLAANTDNNVATQKATKAYVDTAVAAVGGNPTGTIIMFGSVTAPTGYLSCDGTSYLRATYAALFAVIGTTFGAVDGTHFNVPNMDNSFPQGEGSSNSIGGTGGAVSPTITDPGHSHIVGQASDMRNGGATTYDNTSPTNAATTGISIADARPPFLSVAFFIKT